MNRFLLALAGLLLITFGAIAQTTNGLTKAEIQGRQLVQEILQASPITNFTQTAILTIKNSKGGTTNIPVVFNTAVFARGWTTTYVASPTNSGSNYPNGIFLQIAHRKNLPNDYRLSNDWKKLEEVSEMEGHLSGFLGTNLNQTQIMAPFADSDFWIADLGLEFFHWPSQKVLKHEDRRTRACAVLESTNPNPTPGSYSRVVTWIDNETFAIIWAEAYDTNSKLLKEFDPKKVKKINGQWQLAEMEIRNVQTKSRTTIKFDLKSK